MHELALTKSLIDLVEREAKNQGFTRALEIRMKLGEYSGVIPGYILDLFPEASRGTAAEGAKLLFEQIPGRFRCAGCGYEGAVERKSACCPRCGSVGLRMITGREFYVESLKVE